ncbi:general transcription factor iih polypeptide 3 [Cyclospora cayetanensis]|uniref:General transcription factor iih polypeptide 3 n=1 Tax=Cyclospora cayetanensis TaxID=88456 RepID=A0A1D3CZM3_9EIME|nr:general transcription factor iih polypeptide 3 [Cyclospora cayetanensis]
MVPISSIEPRLREASHEVEYPITGPPPAPLPKADPEATVAGSSVRSLFLQLMSRLRGARGDSTTPQPPLTFSSTCSRSAPRALARTSGAARPSGRLDAAAALSTTASAVETAYPPRPPADGCLVVIVDLNPTIWRHPSTLNTFLAKTQPIHPDLEHRLQQLQHEASQHQQHQQQQRENDEQHNSTAALVRYLEFISGSVSRFARAAALVSPQSRLAIVGMNGSTSKLLYEAGPPNWILVQSGVENSGVDLQAALAAFATSSAAAARGAPAAADGSCTPAESEEAAAETTAAVMGAAVGQQQRRKPREGESLLVGALSIALCYINRWRGGGPGAESRMLLLDASRRGCYAAQFIPLLNIAFAACKQSIPEQLCDVARGRCSRFSCCFSQGLSGPAKGPNSLRGDVALLQLLLFWFLPPPSLRPAIAAVSVHQRTNTAVCFCHHSPVDLCFICSCCLAKTLDNGKDRISCDVCKSRFAKGLLKTKLAATVDVSKY